MSLPRTSKAGGTLPGNRNLCIGAPSMETRKLVELALHLASFAPNGSALASIASLGPSPAPAIHPFRVRGSETSRGTFVR